MLFSVLASAIDSWEEQEMESSFYFELELYPSLLLKEGVLSPANNTSGLRTHLLKPLVGAAFVKDECMADKSSLLGR